MFKDRFDAARQLTRRLLKYKGKKDVIILAIPRGGLQIGNPLAKALQLPLDIVLTKKIGYPGNREYAIGAVSLKGEIINPEVEVSSQYIKEQIKELRKKLKERYQLYRGKKKPVSLKGKVVIITDDGVATGSTLLAAIELGRKENPKRIIVAVPVGPYNTIEKLTGKADEVICLYIPEAFFAIGAFYEQFPQVEDEEAIRLLKEVQ